MEEFFFRQKIPLCAGERGGIFNAWRNFSSSLFHLLFLKYLRCLEEFLVGK